MNLSRPFCSFHWTRRSSRTRCMRILRRSTDVASPRSSCDAASWQTKELWIRLRMARHQPQPLTPRAEVDGAKLRRRDRQGPRRRIPTLPSRSLRRRRRARGKGHGEDVQASRGRGMSDLSIERKRHERLVTCVHEMYHTPVTQAEVGTS
jgi:hypothetical protein